MTGEEVVEYVAGLKPGDVVAMANQAKAGHAPAVAFMVAYGAYRVLRRRGLTVTEAKAQVAPMLDEMKVVVQNG